ncbi:aldo/keto reductase [Bifidobacterium lemurum]|nr:aldo/keto reductase [Bifidobacterium lemurum]QOL34257.1 aldo/keto reductase [Bifidobacterium lemurum]
MHKLWRVMHYDAAMMGEPVFAELGERYGKTPTQIILRWHLREGNVVLPKTLNPRHMAENIDIFDFELNGDDMARIGQLAKPIPQRPEDAPDFVLKHYDWEEQI